MDNVTPAATALPLACALARRFEGCRLTPYQDPGGTWTIGYGEVYLPNGEQVSELTPPITFTRANALLESRMLGCIRDVDNVVTTPLSPAQTAALADFVFNVGYGAFRSSTLLKLLNARDIEGAADQFLAWDKAHVNGELVTLPGLLCRRQAERTLFLSGDAGHG